MPRSAQVQFTNRAREALEQGNTSFVARGKNKELYEDMKRTFEQEMNAQSASKRVKLSAVSPAPAPTESNSSDSSSDFSSQQSSSSDEETESTVPTVESCHPLSESSSSAEKSSAPTIESSEEQRQAALAWQAEMQTKQKNIGRTAKRPMLTGCTVRQIVNHRPFSLRIREMSCVQCATGA